MPGSGPSSAPPPGRCSALPHRRCPVRRSAPGKGHRVVLATIGGVELRLKSGEAMPPVRSPPATCAGQCRHLRRGFSPHRRGSRGADLIRGERRSSAVVTAANWAALSPPRPAGGQHRGSAEPGRAICAGGRCSIWPESAPPPRRCSAPTSAVAQVRDLRCGQGRRHRPCSAPPHRRVLSPPSPARLSDAAWPVLSYRDLRRGQKPLTCAEVSPGIAVDASAAT